MDFSYYSWLHEEFRTAPRMTEERDALKHTVRSGEKAEEQGSIQTSMDAFTPGFKYSALRDSTIA